MPPLIGLNACLGEMQAPLRARAFCHLAYLDAIAAAGGIPVIIPPYLDGRMLREALAPLKGFCLIGGPDYAPGHFGGHPQPPENLMHPRRDTFDLRLMALLLQQRLPTLGICGGLQLLNIALGGALVQDLKTEWKKSGGSKSPLPHSDSDRPAAKKDSYRHSVGLARGSLIARIAGLEKLSANSYHHQAILPERLGEGLRATAWTSDGVIEALEPSVPKYFLLGVQWHPERQISSAPQLKIFKALIAACQY